MKNPWVGLRPFATGESNIFFGREKESQIVANLIATLPILIVYAPSGTGKSSLLNAGVHPLLDREDDTVAVFVHDPKDDVLSSVSRQLQAIWDKPSSAELGLVELLQQFWLDTGVRCVVVLDQFEERLNSGRPTEEIYGAIAKLAHSGADFACIVISIREDYLGSLEPLMRRVHGLLNASYRVPPLSRSALESAVYGPLRELGVAVPVEEALIQETLDDVHKDVLHDQEPGEQRFEPGYFQILWSTLWQHTNAQQGESLSLAKYHKLGGAENILQDFTSKILSSLEPAQAGMFWAISRYLVLPTGAKTSLTVEDLTQLLNVNDYLKAANSYSAPWLSTLNIERKARLIRSVLSELTASRAPIFQRVLRADREEYELLHDLLGQIILKWRLRFESEADQRSKLDAQRVKTIADRELRLLHARERTKRQKATGPETSVDGLPTEDERLPTDSGDPSSDYQDPTDPANRARFRFYRDEMNNWRRSTREASEQLERTSLDAQQINVQQLEVLLGRRAALTEILPYWAGFKNLKYERVAEDRRLVEVLLRLAFGHRSRPVREQSQRVLDIVNLQVTVTDRVHRSLSRAVRDNGLAGGVGVLLGLLAAAASYFLYMAPANTLGIELRGIAMAHLALVAVLGYVLISVEEGPKLALFPILENTYRAGIRRIFALLFSWPLPVLFVEGTALACASIASVIGLSATACYFVVFFYALVAVSIGLLFIVLE